MDVVQFIIQQDKDGFGQGPEELLYHAACHHEWTGVAPLKAGEIYASELGKLVGAKVAVSPFCCGESGLGALTSPKIYNRLRMRKRAAHQRPCRLPGRQSRGCRLPVLQDRHQPHAP